MLRLFLRKKNIGWDKILPVIIFLLLLSLVTVVFWQKIEFSSSDLGRHIQNGRIVFSNSDVLFSNFYSYSEPDARFINHHWFSGIIYSIIYNLGGFKLLSIFNILLALVIFSIFFFLAKKRSDFYTAAILSLPVIFLLSERIEVRPEMFSYLFFGITWLVLENKKFSHKGRLFILFPLFILWANMHIYFFLGLALIFFWLIDKVIKNCFWRDFKSLKSLKKVCLKFKLEISFFLFLILAALFTPNHIEGLLYPLNVLREYGYQITENKSIFFLDNLMLNHNFLLFKLLILLLVIALLANYLLRQKKTWFDWLLGFFVSAFALFASRNLVLFALVALVLISSSAGYVCLLITARLNRLFLKENNLYNWKIFVVFFYIFLLLGTFIFFVTDLDNRQMFLSKDPGLGLTDDSLSIFEFFKDNNLSGPIFNNYDAGSALIFGLYGQEKVFVDNRPEAYSVSFFQDIYVPMQEDHSVWQKQQEKYGFKTIIFAYTDSTSWAKKFLTRILMDDSWAFVYFDRYYVILVNKEEYSSEFLEKNTINNWDFRNRLRELAANNNLNGKASLANLAQAVNQSDLALEIYRQLILAKPNNYQTVFSLAHFYSASFQRADLYRALEYFNRGLKQVPKMPGIYNQMALVYWQLTDYIKAEEYWEKAEQTGDKSARDYLRQIEDLKKQGQISR